ncbi:MAG: hypothetical protein V1746_00730 [bacterium]
MNTIPPHDYLEPLNVLGKMYARIATFPFKKVDCRYDFRKQIGNIAHHFIETAGASHPDPTLKKYLRQFQETMPPMDASRFKALEQTHEPFATEHRPKTGGDPATSTIPNYTYVTLLPSNDEDSVFKYLRTEKTSDAPNHPIPQCVTWREDQSKQFLLGSSRESLSIDYIRTPSPLDALFQAGVQNLLDPFICRNTFLLQNNPGCRFPDGSSERSSLLITESPFAEDIEDGKNAMLFQKFQEQHALCFPGRNCQLAFLLDNLEAQGQPQSRLVFVLDPLSINSGIINEKVQIYDAYILLVDPAMHPEFNPIVTQLREKAQLYKTRPLLRDNASPETLIAFEKIQQETNQEIEEIYEKRFGPIQKEQPSSALIPSHDHAPFPNETITSASSKNIALDNRLQ